MPEMNYGEYKSKLFEGQVSVKQGKFTAQFVVPRNIDTKLGNGLVQVYAVRGDSLADAGGGNNRIWVGGNEQLANDIKPPTLQLYLNNESFVDGSQVDDSPILIAKLNDENGLNLNQNMTLTLNDTFTVVVNEYFVANKDDFRSGTIHFPFHKLPTGTYVLRLKVGDTYNNLTEGTLKFRVGEQITLIKQCRYALSQSLCRERLNLQLELINEGEDVEIETRIFDLNGQLIRVAGQTIYQLRQNYRGFYLGRDESFESISTSRNVYLSHVGSLPYSSTDSGCGR
jgi:hypothetical protein